jgi:hypothetical protein
MAQAIPVGLGLGQQWASNPNLNAPAWVQNGLSHLDPLGNAITKIGGDPLNLYGNKNNPNALLFPSGGANGGAGGVPGTLPSFNIPPSMPGGSFMKPNLGGGLFNAMAANGAGPLFVPSAPQRFPVPAANPGGTIPQLQGPRIPPPQILPYRGSRP